MVETPRTAKVADEDATGASVTSADRSAAGSMRGDSLLASVFLLVGLTIVQRFIGFGRNIVFCGWLEDDQLGRWPSTFCCWQHLSWCWAFPVRSVVMSTTIANAVSCSASCGALCC